MGKTSPARPAWHPAESKNPAGPHTFPAQFRLQVPCPAKYRTKRVSLETSPEAARSKARSPASGLPIRPSGPRLVMQITQHLRNGLHPAPHCAATGCRYPQIVIDANEDGEAASCGLFQGDGSVQLSSAINQGTWLGGRNSYGVLKRSLPGAFSGHRRRRDSHQGLGWPGMTTFFCWRQVDGKMTANEGAADTGFAFLGNVPHPRLLLARGHDATIRAIRRAKTPGQRPLRSPPVSSFNLWVPLGTKRADACTGWNQCRAGWGAGVGGSGRALGGVGLRAKDGEVVVLGRKADAEMAAENPVRSPSAGPGLRSNVTRAVLSELTVTMRVPSGLYVAYRCRPHGPWALRFPRSAPPTPGPSLIMAAVTIRDAVGTIRRGIRCRPMALEHCEQFPRSAPPPGPSCRRPPGHDRVPSGLYVAVLTMFPWPCQALRSFPVCALPPRLRLV